MNKAQATKYGAKIGKAESELSSIVAVLARRNAEAQPGDDGPMDPTEMAGYIQSAIEDADRTGDYEPLTGWLASPDEVATIRRIVTCFVETNWW